MGESLCECPDCGLFQHLPPLRPGQVADCSRCGALLRRRRRNSFSTTLALMLAGMALYAITLFTPLLSFRLLGQVRGTTLPALPLAYDPFGMWELSIVVFFTTLAAPLLKLMLTAMVLFGLQRNVSPPLLAAMARIRTWLTPWSMTEVFLLGLFVAYTRIAATATSVQVGTAFYAMGGLMLVMVCADAWLDEHAMWDAIGRRRNLPADDGGTGQADRLRHVRPSQPGRARAGLPALRLDAAGSQAAADRAVLGAAALGGGALHPLQPAADHDRGPARARRTLHHPRRRARTDRLPDVAAGARSFSLPALRCR